jgi:hypothetical protein
MWRRAVIPAVALACLSTAHMILHHPNPYGALTLDSSPLDATGADFPCKQRNGVYDVTEMNYWKAGERQSVSFNGTAVHGGGSCQFSLTTDLQPTASSKWKVIHSVVGGCPASADGNLAAGQPAATFDFMVPESLPSGVYTFAWTWFNRRGHREMYMNCAPISVSGAPENATFLDDLPDMFVANLPGTLCTTVEDFDFAFPEPGDSVSTGTPVTIVALQGTGCVSIVPSGSDTGAVHLHENVKGISSSSGQSPAGFPGASNTRVREAATWMPRSTLVTTPAVRSATMKLADEQLLKPHPSSAPLETEGKALVTCISCSQDGSILCLDETHFGICDHGCATRQLLAEGTSCSQGSIVTRTRGGAITE